MTYEIGDEFIGTEDFFMEPYSGGERAFTTGKVYEVVDIENEDGPEGTEVVFFDDNNEYHVMTDTLIRQHFKKKSDPIEAYNRAMGIIK